MVLFLHNTSRVDGDAYPTLLTDKGFRGFPSLAFMDADGNVIAAPGERTVSAFTETLGAVESYLELTARAGAGDESVANALFIAELQLAKIGLQEAKRRYAELDGLTDDQKKAIDTELLALEVNELINQVMSGRVSEDVVASTFADMAKAERVPSGAAAGTFWQLVLYHADITKDAKLFEQSLEILREMFGGDERNAQAFENWERRLKELKGGS